MLTGSGTHTADFSCTGTNQTNDTPCENDGNKCTIEHCEGGVCGAPVTAKCPEPTNPCKKATCGAQGGCGLANRQGFCNDGNPCTINEQCASGRCDAAIINVGSGIACDDKNDCTTGETCNGSGSCTGGTNVASGTACDDFNDCIDGTTCNGAGTCGNGTTNTNGSSCLFVEPGNGLFGNTCRNAGTCSMGMCAASEKLTVEGATCTNGDPCNDGFCSGGNCIRRDPTQQSGTVEDYNACSSSTTCNTAGVATPTCLTSPNTCPICMNDCTNDPGLQTSGGTAVPCACTNTQ
jgi:hypothetical protein